MLDLKVLRKNESWGWGVDVNRRILGKRRGLRTEP